jgi:hypothetical protein
VTGAVPVAGATIAGEAAAGARPATASDTLRVRPPPATRNVISAPGGAMRTASSNFVSALSAATRRPMSIGARRTACPLTASTRFPGVIPARSAGPLGVTLATSRPSVSRGPPVAATLMPISRIGSVADASVVCADASGAIPIINMQRRVVSVVASLRRVASALCRFTARAVMAPLPALAPNQGDPMV